MLLKNRSIYCLALNRSINIIDVDAKDDDVLTVTESVAIDQRDTWCQMTPLYGADIGALYLYIGTLYLCILMIW